MKSLKEVLEAERSKAEQLAGHNRDLEEQLDGVKETQSELLTALSEKEDELKAVQQAGNDTRTRVLQASADLAEERKKVAHELSCMLAAERKKNALESKLQVMEQELSGKAKQLATVEKRLKEKEDALHKDSMINNLAQVEANLRDREARLQKPGDRRVQTLQTQLAEERKKKSELKGAQEDLHAARKAMETQLQDAMTRKGELQNAVKSADAELKASKASVEDVRAFAAQAEAALEEERNRAELARKECSELTETRDKAELSKAALESRLREMERRLKAGQAGTEDWAQLLGGQQPAFAEEAVPPGEGPPGSVASWGAAMAGSRERELLAKAQRGGDISTISQEPNWEPAAQKLFSRLDVRGDGCVENDRVLQLWPVLSRHVETANSAALAAQLLQSSLPMRLKEWMALMKALHSIVGPRRLRRNIRSAEAYLAELPQAGAGGTSPEISMQAKFGSGGPPGAAANVKHSFLNKPRAVPGTYGRNGDPDP